MPLPETDPVRHLKQKHPAELVDEIFNTLSKYTIEFIAVNHTEKCLSGRHLPNHSPLTEMRAILESWDAVGDPVTIAQKGAQGIDPFE